VAVNSVGGVRCEGRSGTPCECKRAPPPPPRCSPSRLERESAGAVRVHSQRRRAYSLLSLAPQCRQSKKGRTRPTPTTAPRYQGCIRSARLITHRDRTKGKSAVAPLLCFTLCVCCVHAFRPLRDRDCACFVLRGDALLSLGAGEGVCVSAFWGISAVD
jgi:hypothetical protein